jgi:hypothetical protein
MITDLGGGGGLTCKDRNSKETKKIRKGHKATTNDTPRQELPWRISVEFRCALDRASPEKPNHDRTADEASPLDLDQALEKRLRTEGDRETERGGYIAAASSR